MIPEISHIEFDFGSIMHVDPLFGRNIGKPTYTYNRYTFQAEEEFQKIYDQMAYFSRNVVKFANGVYCRNKYTNNCQNGGFPRKYYRCVCPLHFGGLKCNTPKNSIDGCLPTKKYIAKYY
uniref:EGF-like domain-containing protein n=1 Tax=Strongyloides venezuelensis TaxID=75913 RepID=A0A0K0FEJ2_STRVS